MAQNELQNDDSKSKISFYIKRTITILALIMAAYHIYAPLFGNFGALKHRSLHMIFAFGLIFLSCLVKNLEFQREKSFKVKLKIISDIVLFAASIWVFGYVFVNYNYIVSRIPYATSLKPIEIINGLIALLIVLEASRRVVGWILTSVGLTAIAYIFLGKYMPSVFHHRGYSLEQFIETQYLVTDGLFGMPIAVSSSYIILFVIFGALLQAFGLGDLILYASKVITGRTRGGPAKLAVVASGLMGMISGSSISNVATTGTITIPLMKKNGYKSEFAGAVEAAASTGGQLMPPVMGIVIFLMADFTGIPYVSLLRNALLPGILYFLAIFIIVHLRAVKQDLEIFDFTNEEKGEAVKALRSKGHLLLSIIVFVFLLIKGYSAIYSVVVSIFATIFLGMAGPQTRISLKKLIQAIKNGIMTSADVVASCAIAGIVVGVAGLTGIGARFSNLVIDVAGGDIYLALIFAMFASLILGMGLPVGAAYILQVAFVIPALTAVGVDVLSAHLFVIYFCAVSMITPPVALTSFVAAGIADADIMKTSIQATMLGMVAYIIPYIFVFNPEILLIGTPFNILLASVTAILGIVALAAALEGFLFNKIGLLMRVCFFACSILLILPGIKTDIAGTFILVFLGLLNRGSLFSRSSKEKVPNYN